MKSKNPNIAIIVLDTMRYDAFERLASKMGGLEGFVMLKNCIAPSSWTLPSHASLFTGMYPHEHGAHETKAIKSLDIERIKLRKRTFVADLNEIGYNTFAISANPYITPVYGFDEFKSFEEETYFTDVFGSIWEVSDKLKPLVSKYRNENFDVSGNNLINNVIKLPLIILRDNPGLFTKLAASAIIHSPPVAFKKIKAKLIDGWPIEKGGKNIVKRVKEMRLKEPFFLFINIMEPHDPYVGTRDRRKDVDMTTSFLKEKPSPKLVAKWKRLYDLAAKRGYGYAIEIIKELRQRFGENQLIILTSDHGQCLNEHGFIGHGSALYDELVHVPFAMLLPQGMQAKKGEGKYQSLVNVRNFINALLKGNKDATETLYSDKVYSESFGIPTNIKKVEGIDLKKAEKFERYSKRIFHDFK